MKTLVVGRTLELFKKIQTDPERRLLYRNEIVELNLPLVPTVLKKYKPYTDDQFQACCLGLIMAVDTFKEEIGVPFSSYACFCIEREIHKGYRAKVDSIEYLLADKMVYINASTILDNGDELTNEELIADIMSEEAFTQLLDENSLETLFEKIIKPSVTEVASITGGVPTKINLEQWKMFEMRYLLELAEFDSQKYRFNLTKMAKILGVTPKNIRDRHMRVLNAIRRRCKELGYGQEL